MIRPFLIATALLALAACSKPAATDAATSTPAAAAASASGAPTAAASAVAAADSAAADPSLPSLGDFKIVSVLLGNAVDPEHVVITDTRSFGPKDPIYASVLSIGAHQGLKISAEWLAPDGTSIARSEQPVVPTTDLATTFNIRNPADWPSGDYQLKIGINGHAERTETFTVH